MIDLARLLVLARKVALKSPCRFKIAAILFDGRGRVVATGYNHLGLGRGRMGHYTTHAEADALNKIRKPSRNLSMLLFRMGDRLVTPCSACEKLIRAYGIREVIYTTKWGT